ncbi:hypothetical protein RB195_010153 [Necator americanus]|uniref:Uncharacterized protein n=1 Tax=Necator americanus TaxID=51031 RepID=A0ABR1CWN1_NECAM
MEKIIHDFYSDLFDSHVHLPPHHLREDGHVIPEVLPSEVRHTIMSVLREYKIPLRPTFVDFKKAFESSETEAVTEALDNQSIRATLESAMRKLEWDDDDSMRCSRVTNGPHSRSEASAERTYPNA